MESPGNPVRFRQTTAEILGKILESEPEPLSTSRTGLPPDLYRIVRRCLRKNPDDRYNNTRDLVVDLKLEDSELVVSPSVELRRSKVPWILAGILVLITIAVLWSFWGKEYQEQPGKTTQLAILIPPDHMVIGEPPASGTFLNSPSAKNPSH